MRSRKYFSRLITLTFVLTLLVSVSSASTEGGISQVNLEPKILGPGEQKTVTKINVSDNGKHDDNLDLLIDYFSVRNDGYLDDNFPDHVSGSELVNVSVWTESGSYIASNSTGNLISERVIIGAKDDSKVYSVGDNSWEILSIKVTTPSDIEPEEDGMAVNLGPQVFITDLDESSGMGTNGGDNTPNTSVVDARPEISSATTLDQNGNGKLEAVNVSFTESVELSNPEGGNNALPGLSVGSYELENHDYDGNKGEYHVIHLTEGEDEDTGATPQVSYDEGTNTIVDADQLENELRSTGGVTPSDGAAPVADVSYENNGSDVNYVDVEFSEPVKSHSILDANDWSWQNPGELNQIDNISLSWDQETPEREFRIDILNGRENTNLGDTTLKYTDNGNIGDGTNSFSGEGSPYSLEDEASPSLIQTADLVAKDKVQVNFSEEVDGAGGDLVAGDFNFTGSQNIESVSGTGFSRQVNITFSENLESSNLGSNTVEGPEGDSVGVEENSVQDEADNYAEVDAVGLRDPQGLIDSTSSIKINPTAFSGGCTIKKEGSEGSCNSADGIMVQLSDSGGAYDVRESNTFRINSSNGKSLNVSPVFSDPDTSLDAYGLVFNRIYDSEGRLYQAEGDTPEIRIFKTDGDLLNSSRYYNETFTNQTAVEFSGDTGMFQDEVIQEYRVELIENGEVMDSTGLRAYGIGYEGQFSQNETEVRFNKDGGINVEDWYVNLLLYKDDPWVRDDRVEIEKTRNGNFVLPKNKIDAPEGKYNWSFQIWPEGNRQGSNRTVHLGGEKDATISVDNIPDEMLGEGAEDNPYIIEDIYDLQAMEDDLDAYYKLANDIDASETSEWNSGKGFDPVGNSSNYRFKGIFDGAGYEISNLTIDRPNAEDIGLFGYTDDSTVLANFTLVNASVTGLNDVGTVAGWNNDGTISNVSATGEVIAQGGIGGRGGIAGSSGGNAEIRRTVANVTVTGGDRAGGLVGLNTGTIVSSAAHGDVSGEKSVGGIVGNINDGNISKSFSTGSVQGTENIGGFLGVSGGVTLDNYWDKEASGQASSDGNATGLTTSEMTGSSAENNMEALDFESIWQTKEGDYPVLLSRSGSEGEISIEAFEADFETGEEIPEEFKGVIIVQLEASSKPASVSLTIEDSEGNEMTSNMSSQETIEENDGVYTVGVPVPADEGIQGEHFVEIDSLNGEDVDRNSDIYKTGVFIGSESEEPPEDEPVETVSADDFYTNTTTDYSVASAFVGHTLEVTAESGVFSLINGSNNVEETVNVSKNENFSTSDLEEGRYKLNSSDGNLSEIDIFQPDSDVISRIANVSGPEVRVFDYTRMDEVDLDSNKVNISGPENWQTSEHVFRMNSSLDRYWIQVDGDDRNVAEASRTAKQERLERCDGYEYGDEDKEFEVESSTEDDDQCIKGELGMPYVQDFAPEEGFNVSGTVYNKDSQNDTVSDLKLKLVKNELDYRLDERGPLRESPPIITTMTGESGEYTFENVPAAGYNLYVVNDSWAPVKGSQYFDPEIWVTGDMSGESLAVTDKTGKLNLTIDGPQKDFVYGYNLNRVDERGWYSQLGIGAGETNITLPTGEYYVGIRRQSLTGETPSQRSLGKVNVTEDDLTNISASYADTVYLNGSVKQEESILDIDDAYISIRSKGDREQRKGYWTRVEDGEFSRKVAENTNYTVRLSPPYQSSYTDKEKDIEVNESSATLNFSLEIGKHIAGEIEANGEPVEARVRVSNSSEGIWRNTETEDGVYNVTGLKNGSYEVSVQPRNPRYSEASKQVTLSGGSNGSVDFELGGNTAVLNGTVSFEGEGSPEGVEVEVEAEDPFVEDREEELGSDGVFSFEVPEDTYYSIEVEGEVDGEEKDKRKTRYISGNETVDFAFETLQKFEGVVKTDSGERVRAWVGARNFSERSRDYTRTGEDGEFELELSKAPHKVVIEPHPSESVGSDKIKISEEDVVDGRNFTYDLSSYTYLQGEVDFQGINSSEGFIAVGNESAESFNYQKLQNGSFNLTGLKDAGHRVFIASRKGNLRKETTIDSPVQIGKEKNFTLGETAKKKVVVRTHSGSDTGPIEPNVTVQTRETEELTNSSGEAVFKVDPRSTTQFYVDKDGFRSNIREITVDGDTSSVREVDVGINQTQEYSVRINVSKEGNSDSDISPPASVVFVSRNNQSAEGGSVTVNTEGARPSIDGLTTGEYLVGVAEGPETEYVNKTAEIPEEDPLSQTDTVKMTDSDGETRYTVWYEVTQ